MTSLQQTFDVDHPVALVTGSGAARVGQTIATVLAEAGCHISLHANRSVHEANNAADRIRQRFECRTLVTTGSLDDDSVPDRLVSETHQHFGRIDIVVSSAAIWHPTPLQEVTATEIRRYFEVNTLAAFLLARAAGNIMQSQPNGGSIVNLGDWATVRPYLDHAAYFPSKGAVEAMTRSLAVELAQLNPRIRVNCIQPRTGATGGRCIEGGREPTCAKHPGPSRWNAGRCRPRHKVLVREWIRYGGLFAGRRRSHDLCARRIAGRNEYRVASESA